MTRDTLRGHTIRWQVRIVQAPEAGEQLESRYFEDFTVGSVTTFGHHDVTRKEIIAFASQWDPQPFHVDDASASASVFGGLTASACHTFSISSLLSSRQPESVKYVAMLGLDEMRFPNPVRPGDRLSMVSECVEARESERRADVGIVTTLSTLSNQEGLPVLTMKSTFMVEKRPRAPS
jgi:acyl dehydratase